jgi:hypothetical protein
MAIDFSDNDTLPDELTPERLAVFCRLHQLETWFRELVYTETKARFGSAWWTECTNALKRNKDRGIAPEKSLKRDAKHTHMATAENDPLWFLSFDSLLKILFDRKLWKLFSPYLTTKQLVRAKFIELMPIRHRIAHCRALHPDDLGRVEHVMRDFDQGFWTFCTSYNNSLTFRAEGGKRDPVFVHVETGLQRTGRTEVAISLLVRPTARYPRSWSAADQKGLLYDVRFIAHHPNRFKSADVLKYTSERHADIVHIFLDSLENSIRVTIPALLGATKVIDIINRFDHVCKNTTTPFAHPLGELSEKDEEFKKRVKRMNAAMNRVARQWPHYVIPPGNPMSFLGPDCPCSFFGVS